MTFVDVELGDITAMKVDAIVNAANQSLLGGGGVDGAIHAAAGPELLNACRRIAEVRPGVRCPTGEARVTPGFRLPARFVIHTVGPVWRGGNNDEPSLLANCYRSVLAACAEHEIRSLAIPAISCGAFGFPVPDAARIAVEEVTTAIAAGTELESILLVAFEPHMHRVLAQSVRTYLPLEAVPARSR
jgi:O-acetyl-ADP-ribose deacetylase (regulator of RNase III)